MRAQDAQDVQKEHGGDNPTVTGEPVSVLLVGFSEVVEGVPQEPGENQKRDEVDEETDAQTDSATSRNILAGSTQKSADSCGDKHDCQTDNRDQETSDNTDTNEDDKGNHPNPEVVGLPEVVPAPLVVSNGN